MEERAKNWSPNHSSQTRWTAVIVYAHKNVMFVWSWCKNLILKANALKKTSRQYNYGYIIYVIKFTFRIISGFWQFKIIFNDPVITSVLMNTRKQVTRKSLSNSNRRKSGIWSRVSWQLNLWMATTKALAIK